MEGRKTAVKRPAARPFGKGRNPAVLPHFWSLFQGKSWFGDRESLFFGRPPGGDWGGA